ncbi:MAG TPA: hypothetical protein VIF40_18325 [Methylosinus sp.]|jgi:hypothetical protein|uniref:hypothetical protein n=1 Tax=Methylosinus sp. TaxID=427 RepID=UPI002F95C5B2
MFSLLLDHLPESERDEAFALQRNVASLTGIYDSFEAAVTLFEDCSGPPPRLDGDESRIDMKKHNLHKNWRFIAAKSGAMSIYEFYQIIHSINKSIKKCPTLAPLVDINERKKSAKLFDDAFPKFGGIRNSLAHGAEATSDNEKILRHALMPFGGELTILMNSAIIGNEFCITVDGTILGYLVSRESVDKLKAALDALLKALQPLQNFRRK